MVHPVFVLPAIVGVVILLAGVLRLILEPTHRSPAEWFVALGPVLFAAPLATFGTEHFVIPNVISNIVPSWLPARLWITYFVGAALIAASLSFISRKQTRLAAVLTAVMFLSFICLIHAPGAATHLRNRDYWIDALRDSAFGIAAFTLFLQLSEDEAWRKRRLILFPIARVWVAIVVLAFAVLQLLHPECSPGVPSLRTTPSWVPLPLVLGYGTGVALLILGLAMFFERISRGAAVAIATWMAALTLFLYVTDTCLLPASQRLLGVNYIFDTMMFAGAMLLVAQVLPIPHGANAPIPRSSAFIALEHNRR